MPCVTTRAPKDPGFDRELELLAAFSVVAFVDEVGRGCAAGPVSCGAVLLTAPTPPPPGLRDSKLLSPARRRALVPVITDWAADSAVGHAWPEEIDDLGLTAALRLAALRALRTFAPPPTAVLLDGSHNWLHDNSSEQAESAAGSGPEVFTMVKADLQCAAVAAASILAKVERDDLMVLADGLYPGYEFATHKGYLTPQHVDALQRLGPAPIHRRSWSVRGVAGFHGTRRAH